MSVSSERCGERRRRRLLGPRAVTMTGQAIQCQATQAREARPILHNPLAPQTSTTTPPVGKKLNPKSSTPKTNLSTCRSLNYAKRILLPHLVLILFPAKVLDDKLPHSLDKWGLVAFHFTLQLPVKGPVLKWSRVERYQRGLALIISCESTLDPRLGPEHPSFLSYLDPEVCPESTDCRTSGAVYAQTHTPLESMGQLLINMP